MKKGQYQYLMLVYGISILAVTLLIALFLFSFKSSTDIQGYSGDSSLDINFLNYLRTSVAVNELEFSMADLIIYSYYTNDFSKLDERTKIIFDKLYGDKCFWEIRLSLEDIPNLNFHVISNLGLIPDDSQSVYAVIPGLKGENINVRLIKKC
ncbi:hypothetical protein HY500_00710 [Candidatus Woesearchaeota archaeon]|nr:hypothetical protein [Candidatus Woesearchaeota archaeon]